MRIVRFMMLLADGNGHIYGLLDTVAHADAVLDVAGDMQRGITVLYRLDGSQSLVGPFHILGDGMLMAEDAHYIGTLTRWKFQHVVESLVDDGCQLIIR